MLRIILRTASDAVTSQISVNVLGFEIDPVDQPGADEHLAFTVSRTGFDHHEVDLPVLVIGDETGQLGLRPFPVPKFTYRVRDKETKKFDVENREKFIRGRRLTRMHATYWPFTDIICGLQMLAGFYIGGRLAIDGVITAGTYITYSGLVIQIIWPIRRHGRWVVWAISLLELVFVAGAGLLFLESVTDLLEYFKGMTPTTTVLFSVPWIIGILALALPRHWIGRLGG